MKQIFIENLPKYTEGTYKNKINWKESIGCKVKFIYDNIEGEIKIINYEKKNQTLIINYKNKTIKMTTSEFVKCRFGNLLNKITKEFKVEIGQIFKDDKRDLIIIDKEYRKNNNGINRKWYKYKCNKCGWDEGWIVENDLLKGQGCSCCANRTVVEGINDIPTTAPWMVKYFQGGYDEAKLYTKSSNRKIYPICPDCGRIKNKSIEIGRIYRTHSIGCSCKDGISYPNKLMYNILEQLKIEFETEYSPKWIKPMRYDFYFELDNKKYIVEMDGGLGHGKKIHSKSNKTIEETLEIDNHKDKQAKLHNIEVIRIDCQKSELEYIKNSILNSGLNKIHNLKKVDWNKSEEFALSNLIKKTCEYKKNNIEMSTIEISKMININRATIIRYLKKGNNLGWCEYNPKEEKSRINKKAGKKNGKPVEIFKDGISSGIFPSCAELERQSEKLFGVKLFEANISAICNNKQKLYKNFMFRYL